MIIKCKNCGGDMELNAEKTFGTCEFCGSAMTLPKLSDEQRLAAFNRGNHFRRLGEFDKALAVYERIVQEDDTDAEAHWCCALCRFGIEYVEDPSTYEWLPTCHRASFDSFLEDVDYKAALEYSDGVTRRQYMKDAAKIAEVQRSILATSQNAEPYDVFICYKETDENGQRTRDSLLAQDIYYQLTEQGRRVFFARITLEDVAGSQYEPYIFAALNSAKVMVAVGTKPEHFNAVWVKNEWSRFLAMMKKDHSKLLLPCYRDMDPYDLPEQLSVLQSYDMSKIGFIQDLIRGVGKVLDAEKKAAPTVAPTETVVVQQNSNVTALLKRGAMALEDGEWTRADEFYEEVLNQDAECAEAYLGKALCEEECGSLEALYQKLLRRSERAETEKKSIAPDAARIAAAAQKYAVPGYLEEETIRDRYKYDLTYPSTVSARRKQLEEGKRTWEQWKLMNRAEKFASGELAASLAKMKAAYFATLSQRIQTAEAEEAATVAELKKCYAEHLDKADKEAEELYSDAAPRREEEYRALCGMFEWMEKPEALRELKGKFEALNGYSDSAAMAEHCVEKEMELLYCSICSQFEKETTHRGFWRLAERFDAIADYRDSATMAKRCVEKAREIEVAEAAEAERQRIIAAEEAERQRVIAAKRAKEQARKNKRNAIIFAIVAVLGIAAYVVYSFGPAKAHREAETLMAAGDFDGAVAVYTELGDKDAPAAEEEQKAVTAVDGFSISSGNSHTVGLKTDGTVVATGSNMWGQCDVSDWRDIVLVATGTSHTLGLKADGTVVAAGKNNGQCNVEDWTDIVAISGGLGQTVGVKSDGTVLATGENFAGQCEVSGWRDIVAVSAGYYHTVGLKSDGTVAATQILGDNGEYGQCDVSGWTNILTVAAGNYHTVGLKSDGTVVAVGANRWGQCDVSGWTDIIAISAGDRHTVGLKSDGTVVAVGTGDQCDVNNWKDIIAIAAGEFQTLGLKSDGTVVAVGDNNDGECNVSGWTDIKLPKISEHGTQQRRTKGEHKGYSITNNTDHKQVSQYSIEYIYDENGLLIREERDDGRQIIDYEYDENGVLTRRITSRWDRAGASKPREVLTEELDPYGNFFSYVTEYPASGEESSVPHYENTFAADGHLEKRILTYKTGSTTWEFGEDGRELAMTVADSREEIRDFRAEYIYDEHGQRLEERFYYLDSGEQYQTKYYQNTYDDAGRLMSQKTGYEIDLGYSEIQEYEYEYDDLGNLVFYRYKSNGYPLTEEWYFYG